MEYGFIHVAMPAAIIISYTLILKAKGINPNEPVCNSSDGVRIDMNSNPNAHHFNPNTNNYSSDPAVPNFTQGTMPVASAPAPEVPWYEQPSTNVYGSPNTFSSGLPPPPAYES